MSADLEKNEAKVSTKQLSRRDFLKIAGVAGAAVGMGAGLGGLLSACGEEKATITTAGATTTAAGATTTTVAGTTTSASTQAEMGREIKIGWAIPLTGGLAGFALPSKYIIHEFENNVWKDGMVLGDGKKHPIKCVVADTQSDTNRASQVAGDLITNAKVDMIGANGADDTVDPVAVQAETLGCPSLTCGSPNWGWYKALGRPEPGPKWCYHFCFTEDQFGHAFVPMWNMLPTNKKVAWLMWNSAAGINYNSPEGVLPIVKESGFEVVDPGMFEFGTTDYSAQISAYKKAGCEILMASILPPDFSNFWKQAIQQSFSPKIATIALAVLFPEAVESLGTAGNGLSVEVWWHPTFGYVSETTGMTSPDLAKGYEEFSGNQWTPPVVYYSLPEVWTDVLKRAANPEDKDSIIEATKATKLMTVQGPVDYTLGPLPNSCQVPVCVGQWVATPNGPHKYDITVVSNVGYPDVPIGGEAFEIPYSTF